jgi:hypothetical protein
LTDVNALRLTMHDDPVVLYSLHSADVLIGEVRPHAPHAAILRIGAQAWWLADDVATSTHAAGASIVRRIFAQLTRPRRYSLREDGGERVLARAERQGWRSTREDGLVCDVGGAAWRVRSLGAWGGRFVLEHDDGKALGEFRLTGLGRSLETGALPFATAEAALLLYATHRNFGRDVRAAGASE